MSIFARQRQSRRILLSTVVLAVISSVLSPIAVGAQDANLAATTPIAVPFVGSFEVWCTSGNPAPGTLCRTHHSTPAIDFGLEPGDPINATGDGVVTEIETSCGVNDNSCRGGAGRFISILHDDGRYSRYLHLSAIFVEEGQDVQVGDVIGEAGNTGATSAPHLHYDEQFPLGTRVLLGTMIACVDGEQVLYPDSLGLSEWNDVPFGTVIRNDDYSCLADGLQPPPIEDPVMPVEDPSSEPAPIIASGDGIFAITAPVNGDTKDFEAEIRAGGETTIVSVSSTTFTILDERDQAVEIRLRRDSSSPWSASVSYDPATVATAPTCEGLHATSDLLGGRGPDVIIGTDGDDLIRGEQGDDIICAGDGDDIIFGGRGADSISGDAGNDDIRSGIGRDTILGGAGDDALRSGNGIDVVLGQAGDDFVLGGNGNDDIGGGAGDDFLDGRNGDDIIKGGGGDDTLIGNRHNDELVGGAGTDTFDGGLGVDTCNVKAAEASASTGCES